MIKRSSAEIGRIIRDGTAIDRAMVRAHRAVILRHRQLGQPLVIWRDGQVVEVSPFDVELPVVDELDGNGTAAER
ncbi:MAG: hypothetical protein AAB289_08370 [Chloroflexota bacterium]